MFQGHADLVTPPWQIHCDVMTLPICNCRRGDAQSREERVGQRTAARPDQLRLTFRFASNDLIDVESKWSGKMEQNAAVAALGALAQETRLAVFRLLVQAGPDGLNAGDIATAVKATPSTLSHHLALLERAGLATSRRQGRMLFYAADYAGTRRLLDFLMEDCCRGLPELCGPTRAAVCSKGTLP
jgi:DNA-binding transcriptional ArsR family regulator